MRKDLPAQRVDSSRPSFWRRLGHGSLALCLAVGVATTGCKQAADKPPEEVDTDTPELDITSGTKVDSADESDAGETGEANGGDTKSGSEDKPAKDG